MITLNQRYIIYFYKSLCYINIVTIVNTRVEKRISILSRSINQLILHNLSNNLIT